MAIPTQFDRDVANLDNLHGSIKIKLRQIEHGSFVSTPEGYRHVEQPTLKRRAELRDLAQAYVDALFAMVPKPEEKPAKKARARASQRA